MSGRSQRLLPDIFAVCLFRKDQLALFGSTQPIDLPIIFNPDFIAAARQRVEADNLW